MKYISTVDEAGVMIYITVGEDRINMYKFIPLLIRWDGRFVGDIATGLTVISGVRIISACERAEMTTEQYIPIESTPDYVLLKEMLDKPTRGFPLNPPLGCAPFFRNIYNAVDNIEKR